MARDERVRGRRSAALLAVLAWTALLLQLWLSISLARHNGGGIGDALVAYLGFFTVTSNLLVALTAGAMAWAPGSRLASPMLRGCSMTAIVVVGIGYHLLLREVWDPQGAQLIANNLLHYVVPIASLAHWLASPPHAPLPIRAPLLWAWYPLAYTVYALLRGLWLGTYPYHFIDVAALGYAQVWANVGALLVAFVLTGALLRWVAARRR